MFLARQDLSDLDTAPYIQGTIFVFRIKKFVVVYYIM